MDLLTLEFLTETSKALDFGAKKYGKHNFKGGIEHTRLLAASIRHIYQYLSGEDLDPESGHSHLGHAAAGLNMALWMIKHRPDLDDRYKDTNTEWPDNSTE